MYRTPYCNCLRISFSQAHTNLNNYCHVSLIKMYRMLADVIHLYSIGFDASESQINHEKCQQS